MCVALDDFGAGRSNLAQVRDFALDKIKIDRSFVDRVCLDLKIAFLTRSIVDMAARLDLPRVAEGIERPDAAIQGWLVAGAMPESMVSRLIKGRSGRPQ